MKPGKIEYYPLTIPQQIMYVEQKYSLNKAVVNICTMLTFDTEIDTRLLMQSCYLAMMRNESSAVRLHKQDKEVVSYLSDQAPEKIEVCDYSQRTEQELYADLDKWSRTAFPNSSMDCQLYRVKLVYKPDGKVGLYFSVSHLAFDAYTLMYVASDMLKIYVALRDDLPIPEYKGDYLKMCREDWTYQNSEKRQADLDFWEKEVFPEEPLFAAVNAEKMQRRKGKNYGKGLDLLRSGAVHYNRRMPAEICNKVEETAARMHIPTQTFYMLAIRTHLSAENNDQEKIMITTTVARRATLLHKRSGGTRVLALPFPLNMKDDMKVADALKMIAGQQKQFYTHTDLLLTDVIGDYFTKMWGKGPFDAYHGMSMTYNPYMVELPEGMEAHLETFSTGSAAMPVYLTIMAVDHSGSLNFNYDCMNIFADETMVDRMHRRMTHALEVMLSDPDASLRDLKS